MNRFSRFLVGFTSLVVAIGAARLLAAWTGCALGPPLAFFCFLAGIVAAGSERRGSGQ